MRHRIFVIGVLLLALSMSGWGGVIAAAFCAHDGGPQAAMTKEHECCRARLEQADEHCAANSQAPSAHEAMAMSKTEEAASLVVEEARDAATLEVEFGRADVCLHCVSRGGLPTTFFVARETEQKRRDASVSAPPSLKPSLPPVVSFTPLLTARQNAPPIAAARRHVLLNVFVI